MFFTILYTVLYIANTIVFGIGIYKLWSQQCIGL